MPYSTTGRAAVSYTYDDYGNMATDVRSGVTANYSYDGNNNLTSVSRGGTTESYLLDGLGHRMYTTGGDLGNYRTRYSIDGKVASLENLNGTTTRYDDFRSDPFGRQVLASRGGINELANNGGYQVRRDGANTVNGLGVPNQITRVNEMRDDVTGQTAVNSLTSATEDLGYSFADGANDTFNWNMVASFSSTGGVGTLSAPVRALSDQLRINPLDIRKAPEVGPKINPGEIKPGGSVDPQNSIGPKLGIQPLGSATPLSTQPLSQPASALPKSLSTLNPLDVKGTGNAVGGLPNLPGAETVKAPMGGSVLLQSHGVSYYDTYGDSPTDLTGTQTTDSGQQQATYGTYGYDNLSFDRAATTSRTNATASYGDAGGYNAAARTTTFNASAVDPRVLAILEQRNGEEVYTPTPGSRYQVVADIQTRIPDYRPKEYGALQPYDSAAQKAEILDNRDAMLSGNRETREQATNVFGSFTGSDMTSSESNTMQVAGTNGVTYNLTHVERKQSQPTYVKANYRPGTIFGYTLDEAVANLDFYSGAPLIGPGAAFGAGLLRLGSGIGAGLGKLSGAVGKVTGAVGRGAGMVGPKLGIQPLGSAATLSTQPLSQPSTAPPKSLSTLNPLDVKGTGNSVGGLPNLPGAETVKAPVGGSIATQAIVVSPVDTYQGSPTDLYGTQSMDTAQQQSGYETYNYNNLSFDTAATNSWTNATATYGDPGGYNAAATTSTYRASPIDPRIQALLEQKQPGITPVDYAAERARGNVYDAKAQTAAINENLNNVRNGGMATNVFGSVTTSDFTNSEANTMALAGRNGAPYELTPVHATQVQFGVSREKILQTAAENSWIQDNPVEAFQAGLIESPFMASTGGAGSTSYKRTSPSFSVKSSVPAAYQGGFGEKVEGAFNYLGRTIYEGLGGDYFDAARTGIGFEGEQLNT